MHSLFQKSPLLSWRCLRTSNVKAMTYWNLHTLTREDLLTCWLSAMSHLLCVTVSTDFLLGPNKSLVGRLATYFVISSVFSLLSCACIIWLSQHSFRPITGFSNLGQQQAGYFIVRLWKLLKRVNLKLPGHKMRNRKNRRFSHLESWK